MAGLAVASPVRAACARRFGALRAWPPPPSIRFAAQFSRKGRELSGGRWPGGIDDGSDGIPPDGGVGVGIGSLHVADRERAGVGAVLGDGAADFLPDGGWHLGGNDAEIDADVEEDGADRTVFVLGEDVGECFFLG